jgi:hypothetical protein
MQKFGEGLWELGLSKRNEVGDVGNRTPRRPPATIYWPRLSPILFSFFLISEIIFGLKIILENPEIIIKSRKILRKLKKSRKLLVMIWVMMNPNNYLELMKKYFRAF